MATAHDTTNARQSQFHNAGSGSAASAPIHWPGSGSPADSYTYVGSERRRRNPSQPVLIELGGDVEHRRAAHWPQVATRAEEPDAVAEGTPSVSAKTTRPKKPARRPIYAPAGKLLPDELGMIAGLAALIAATVFLAHPARMMYRSERPQLIAAIAETRMQVREIKAFPAQITDQIANDLLPAPFRSNTPDANQQLTQAFAGGERP